MQEKPELFTEEEQQDYINQVVQRRISAKQHRPSEENNCASAKIKHISITKNSALIVQGPLENEHYGLYLKNSLAEWWNEIRKNTGIEIPILLVGNETELSVIKIEAIQEQDKEKILDALNEGEE